MQRLDEVWNTFFSIYSGGAAKQALRKVKITNYTAKRGRLTTLPQSRCAKDQQENISF